MSQTFDICSHARERIIITAHRGTFGGNIPCNTLAAYELALRQGADMLEIDHSDTIAMGDGHNDCTMLQAAGLGLAMANGAEVVKQTADRVICSNDEHGVDYVLQHIIKGE